MGNRVQAGRRAEALVADYYREVLGFEIVAQNLRLAQFEIDILVQTPEEQRLVEVRSTAKRTLDDLAWSLVGKKARTLRRTIREMLLRGVIKSSGAFQVDAALVRWNGQGPPTLKLWHNILPGDIVPW